MIAIIGSESWEGTSRYDEDAFDSVQHCLEQTNWDALIEISSALRGGVNCKFGDKYSIGAFNLVKLIEFEDGVKWIARVAMSSPSQDAADLAERMESEVATYKYLQKYSEIPVPEVYAYDVSNDSPVGARYMLMTYIHGTIARKVSLDRDQYLYVKRQIANIQVLLAAHKFDRIGSLRMDESGTFYIGRCLETNAGPYDTAQEFYNAISGHRFHVCASLYPKNVDAERCRGLYLPFLFNYLMPILTKCEHENGPFSLRNDDLGTHNVLIDAEMKIVGVIDCDNFTSAPIHVVAQIPLLGDTSDAPPGLATRSFWRAKTYETGKRGYAEYVEMVKAAEKKIGKETPIADAMTSDGAPLVKGLDRYYNSMDTDSADDWCRSYYYMYYRHLGGSRAVEFTEHHIPEDDEDDEDEEDEEDDEDDKDDEDEDEVDIEEEKDKDKEAEEEGVVHGSEIAERDKTIKMEITVVSKGQDSDDKNVDSQGDCATLESMSEGSSSDTTDSSSQTSKGSTAPTIDSQFLEICKVLDGSETAEPIDHKEL